MFFVLLFLIELFTLFLLSRTLTSLLFTFFYKTTRSKRISVYLMSFLFFPGTLIHELSHLLSASLLQVPVGEIELVPKLTDNNLKLGSVQVAKTDPLRRFLIGVSPFLVGTSILICYFYYALENNLFTNQFFIVAGFYIVFEIGNTMFSSKKDMEGALELILALIILAVIFYLAGFRISALNPDLFFSNPAILQTFRKASLYLAAPIGVDLSLIILLRLFIVRSH